MGTALLLGGCWVVASVSPPRQDGTAPLWIASQMGHSEVVRVMLLRGADRDAARNVSLSHNCGTWGLWGRGWVVYAPKLQNSAWLRRKEKTHLYLVCNSPGFSPNLHRSSARKQSKCPSQLKLSKCCPLSPRIRCLIIVDPPPPELTPG